MFAIDDNPTKTVLTDIMYAGDIDNDGDLDVFGNWSPNDDNTHLAWV